MNIKTPDYKAQAENLRQTLLNYIDCVKEVQFENGDLRKELAFSQNLLKTRATKILELEQTIKQKQQSIKNLRASRKEVEKTAELYKSIIYERDKKILNQKVTIENLFKERDELKKRKEDVTLEYVEALQHSCDLGAENFQLKKKIEELKDRIHELETILNIYEGRKHD